MEVNEIFEGISKKMLTDFDQIQEQIVHHGEKGSQRERTLLEFLDKYLPKKYSLGTGHVLNKKGEISNQCDIVIYDAFNCPLLLAEEGYQLFPIESVFAVIEVKSVFDSNTVLDAAKKIQSVKNLTRAKEIVGIAFFYRTKYVGDQIDRMRKTAHALQNANNLIPWRERIDILCVLPDGHIQFSRLIENSEDEDDKNGDVLLVALEVEASNILQFLSNVIDFISWVSTSKPPLLSYAAQGTIGTVQVFTPTSTD